MQEASFQVGDIISPRSWIIYLNDFTAEQLLPEIRPAIFAEESGVFDSRTYNPESGKFSLSVHTWVVRYEGKGSGSPNETYLNRLGQLGARPDQVDYILLTSHVINDKGLSSAFDLETRPA